MTMLQLNETYENAKGESVKIIYRNEKYFFGLLEEAQQVLRYNHKGEHIDKWDSDLKEKPKHIWVEVYYTPSRNIAVMDHETEEEAERSRDENTIKIIKVRV